MRYTANVKLNHRLLGTLRFAVPLAVIAAATSGTRPALGQCPTSFAYRTVLPIVPLHDLVACDLNGDGRLDLACGSFVGFQTYLGQPDGGFALAFSYTNDLDGTAIAVADFNEDGIPDVVTGSNGVFILLGVGDGTFADPVQYLAGLYTADIAVGRFNSDSHVDIVVSASPPTVLMGSGNGTFSVSPFPGPSFANGPSIAVADFNLDGRSDVAAGGESLTLHFSNPDGSFQPPVVYASAQYHGVLALDLNSDGRPDVAIPDPTGINVFIAGAGGQLQAPIHYFTGAAPYKLAAGDLNGDGLPDLIGMPNLRDYVSVLISTPLSQVNRYQTVQNVAVEGCNEPMTVAIEDFDADGKRDIAVSCWGLGLTVLKNQTAQAIVFSQHPQRQQVTENGQATFTAAAGGSGPLFYRWRKDGAFLADGGPVSGAGTPTLTIGQVSAADQGAAFDCVVSNSCTAATSNPAGLVVERACRADFNGDAFVDFFDLDEFVAAFEAGC